MITKSELGKLLASTETCRVERFKSATDKNKFGEAETGKSVVIVMEGPDGVRLRKLNQIGH